MVKVRPIEITLVHLHDIVNNLTDAVIVLDCNARILMVNSQFCKQIGSTAENCIGRETKDLIAEGLYNRSVVYETIEKGIEVAAIIQTKIGVECLSRSRIIRDDKGMIKFVVVTSTPVSTLANLREELEKQGRLSQLYLRELELLRKHLLISDEFIFESPEMKSLLDLVKNVAPLNSTILITGESGVGKEVLARTIHNNSNRENIFTPISIPSIPESLLESELFGYHQGAFTGASRSGKIGLLEVAQGGTLFLDEVGDIPYPLQVKLLRTIENGEIVRVGCVKTSKLDVRIIAATNRDLLSMVKKGNFREDLFYRLNVVPMHIKPLCQRRKDIEPLCHYFIRNINNRNSLNKYFSNKAMNALRDYNWPGNVREIKNVIENLVARSNSNCISVEDVNSVIKLPISGNPIMQNNSYAISPLQEFESYERTKILEALIQARGNKSKTAELLGMTRTKLYRKLNSYESV